MGDADIFSVKNEDFEITGRPGTLKSLLQYIYIYIYIQKKNLYKNARVCVNTVASLKFKKPLRYFFEVHYRKRDNIKTF